MTVKDNVSSVFKLAFHRRMRMLMPEILWTGISVAYYSGILVTMMSLVLKDVGDDNS